MTATKPEKHTHPFFVLAYTLFSAFLSSYFFYYLSLSFECFLSSTLVMHFVREFIAHRNSVNFPFFLSILFSYSSARYAILPFVRFIPVVSFAFSVRFLLVSISSFSDIFSFFFLRKKKIKLFFRLYLLFLCGLLVSHFPHFSLARRRNE